MVHSTALLISNDSSLIHAVREVVCSINHFNLEVVGEVGAAFARLEREDVVLVLMHLTQEEGENAEAEVLLRGCATLKRPLPTLLLSDREEVEQAVTLLRCGAVDYLSRPLDLNRLALLVEMLTLRARVARPAAPAVTEEATVQTLGKNEQFLYLPAAEMGRLMEQVRRVAPQDTTLLLNGETGTGKTTLARLIHELSPRHNEPFLVLDCGSLATSLIESEMFGHVKGAFTGADRNKEGKFAAAGRGTLLLDEIDALPLSLQAKLLRVVESREFEPVGSNQTQPLQARLLVASNRDLEQEVAAGRFRADLYYRLNVVGFHLPPLRERSSAITPLANKFLADLGTRSGRKVLHMAPEALRALQEWHWPGNIRELRNVIERAVTLCLGTIIQVEDLPRSLRPTTATASATMQSWIGHPGHKEMTPPCRIKEVSEPGIQRLADGKTDGASTLSRTKENAEYLRITEALQRHNNNRQRAAAELGVSRQALYNKLHKYGLMAAS